MIKDIEGFSPELQVKSPENAKVLESEMSTRPVTRADKRIPAKIAHTTQARRRKEVVRQIEAVGPLRVCRVNVICHRIGSVIRFAIKVVIATDIHTI